MNEPLYLEIINLLKKKNPILCLKNNQFSITLNYFFTLPTCCCFPHESHRSLFQIRCFQGNVESYDIGQDYSISGRLITFKVHAETWSWYEVWGGWISIINLIILTLNLKLKDESGACAECLSACGAVCLNKGDSFSYVRKKHKCVSVQDSYGIIDLCEWDGQRDQEGATFLPVAVQYIESLWWQACTTASQSDWQFNHPLYKDSGRNSFRTDPFLIYLRK